MRYPEIDFKIKKETDFYLYKIFSKENRRILDACFYNLYSDLSCLKKKNLSSKEKIKVIKNFIEEYYKKHQREIEENLMEIEKDWNGIKNDFFRLVDKIFKNHPWPKGKYIAYVTIWGIYPRDIKEKIFFIPYKDKKLALEVIAHEMLHFIFYDYLYSHYPKYKKKKYQKRIWKISESFNVIIQNQREWVALFHKRPEVYPELKKLIQKIRKIWREKKDIDYLLKKILPR